MRTGTTFRRQGEPVVAYSVRSVASTSVRERPNRVAHRAIGGLGTGPDGRHDDRPQATSASIDQTHSFPLGASCAGRRGAAHASPYTLRRRLGRALCWGCNDYLHWVSSVSPRSTSAKNGTRSVLQRKSARSAVDVFMPPHARAQRRCDPTGPRRRGTLREGRMGCLRHSSANSDASTDPASRAELCLRRLVPLSTWRGCLHKLE